MADVFESGERVRLKPEYELGEREEWGLVVAGPDDYGAYLVQVDPAFVDGHGDDGLREVVAADLARCAGGDMLMADGQRCGCELCRTASCGHVAGAFDLECPECRMPVMP